MVVRAGLIGYGYWGRNHLATLRDMTDLETIWVCDSYNQPVSRSLPQNTRFTKDYNEVLSDKSTQAVIIATPTSTHYDLARRALEAGKHVLVEKPLTKSLAEAKELLDLSKIKGNILMVGHTFMYNPAVKFAKDLIDRGEIGALRYIDARRINPGPIRSDVNALEDLGTHDIYLALHLIGSLPSTVSYQGTSFNGQVDDISNLVMKFPGGVLTNVHNNWIHALKDRTFIVGGEKKMIFFDDTAPAHKIRIYNVGVNFQPDEAGMGAFSSAITSGDIVIPKLPFKQPLQEELQHFADCIEKGIPCKSDGNDGVNVLKVLEAADRSRLANGLEVRLQ
ncbi:MAG: Gfo/Idh/MocA family oxidoreductase [Nanoarchaeota archaeon]